MLIINMLSLSFANENYEYWGHWTVTPDIVLCQTVPIDIKDIHDAVDYWESQGYQIGNILIWKKCNQSYLENTIKIVPPGQYINIDKHFAYTTVNTIGVNDDIINSSLIEMSTSGIKHKEVIIHEMGHALGIKHINNMKDIMYHEHVYHKTVF